MSGYVAVWIILAVLIFWATGAYKRLVRMRKRAIEAFAAVDAHLHRYVALVQASFTTMSAVDFRVSRSGLTDAAAQFESALKEVRLHPLDAQTMRTLVASYESLCISWSNVRNEPPDLAGASLPETLQSQWDSIALDAAASRGEFNRQVTLYNEAIALFPVQQLAWLLGFKPAQVFTAEHHA